MVSNLSVFPEFKAERGDPETAPHVIIGAASPLWLMFGGAAAAGAAWWWWASRWREAVNVEALSALAPEPLAPPASEWVEPIADPVVEPALDLATEALLQPLELAAEATVETLEAVEAAGERVAEALIDVAEAIVPEPVAPVAMLEPAADVEAVAVEAAPVEAAAEAPIEAVATLADDLTRVVGIGPKLAASLGELGVTSFRQIAAWTAEDIQSIDQLLNLKGRADRDAWVAQAKRFAGAATEA
ncbi:phasin PhaH [Caulobacter sp. ErkDOM-YI]|uniref:phasin PhaH n=1 Tax=unclassified Caulobacter TaxID=2648921 RepID=UPI003AF6AF77